MRQVAGRLPWRLWASSVRAQADFLREATCLLHSWCNPQPAGLEIVLQKRLDHQRKISKFESRPAQRQIPADRLQIMPKEWYISFHGGEEESALNNIHVYSTDGERLRKALNKKSLPPGIKLRELRGFVFGPDPNLYVGNAYFAYSEILKFNGKLNHDGQHDFAQVFVKRHPEMNPGIDHPFNLAFDSEGDLYVSSQNTSLIARYHGPGSKEGKPGTPMPLPESLHLEKANFPPGTFVPSAKLASNGLLDVIAVIFAPNK